MIDLEASAKLVGRTLRGKYRIERVLGVGGMGIVVLARHLKLDQDVAIKLLHSGVTSRPGIIARFAREARAAARLRSDHVVRILDVDEDDDGSPFFVMERLHGNDLEHISKREGKIGVPRAVGFVLQACEAMAEAHARGMVHRDLKPANLFVVRRRDGHENVKILDFGISKTEESGIEEASLTSPAAIIGSPLYMSPEQIRSSKNVDHRADVWALGVVLYQLLTGSLPFHATSVTGLAAAIAADPPRPIRDLLPDAPDEIVRAIDRCLEKDPADRFPDVIELAAAIAPLVGGEDAEPMRRVRKAVLEVTEESDPALRATQEETPRSPGGENPSSAPTGTARHTQTIEEEAEAKAIDLAKSTAGASSHSVRPPLAATTEPANATNDNRRPLRTVGAILAIVAALGVGFLVTRDRAPLSAKAIVSEAAPPPPEPSALVSAMPPATESARSPSPPSPPSSPDAATTVTTTPTRPSTIGAASRPHSSTSASAVVAPAVSSSRSPLDIDLK